MPQADRIARPMATAPPAPTLRTRLLRAGGLTAASAAGAAGGIAAASGGPVVPAAGLGGLVIGAWLLASARQLGTHSGPTLGPAVGVTLARGVLVALLAGALTMPGAGRPGTLLAAVGLLALALDGLDGWVARRTGRASAFGATLDMELDALTVLLLSALAAGRAGAWVLIAGLLRYAYGLAAWAHPAFRRPLDPRPGRRLAAGLAVGGLSVSLAAPLDGRPAAALCLAVVLLLVWSFGRDARWQWRRR